VLRITRPLYLLSAVCLSALLLGGCAVGTKDTEASVRQTGIRMIRALAADDDAAVAGLYGAPVSAAPDLGQLREMLFGSREPFDVGGVEATLVRVAGERRGAPVYEVQLQVTRAPDATATPMSAVVLVSEGRVVGVSP